MKKSFIRQTFLVLTLLNFVCLVPTIKAQSLEDLLAGRDVCTEAYQVQTGFSMHVNPGLYFYTATTYDLPLHLYFVPEGNDESYWGTNITPMGFGDFTCNGIYDNPAFEDAVQLVCKQFNVEMPFQFFFSAGYNDTFGKTCYDMEVPVEYRAGIALYGFTEEIRAWIGVYFSVPGTLYTIPDTESRNCMNNSKSFQEKEIIPLSSAEDPVYQFPIAQWLNDSVLFRWNGTQPLDLWLAKTCEFELDDSDPAIIMQQHITLNPGDTLFISSETMYGLSYMGDMSVMFYAAFHTSGSGQLTFIHNPASNPKENATLLKINEPVSLPAGLSPLYCFPANWLYKNQTMPLVWRTNSADAGVKMYLNPDAPFAATPYSTTAQTTYAFVSGNGIRTLRWNTEESGSLYETREDTYFYVRFVSDKPVEVTPSYWDDSKLAKDDCLKKSRILASKDKKNLNKGVYNTFRVDVQQWMERDQDVLFTFEGSFSSASIWVIGSCGGNLNTSNPNYITSFLLKNTQGQNTRLFTHEEIAGWQARADADGYVYIRINVPDYSYPPVWGNFICEPQNQTPIALPEISLGDQQVNSTILAPYLNQPVDAVVSRTLTPGMFNTLCLPFEVSAEEVADIWGASTQIGILKSGNIDTKGGTFTLIFTESDIIPAATPVIIQPEKSQSAPELTFENRTIVTAASECRTTTSNLDFVGLIDPTTLEGGNKNLIFLQANNTLNWPDANGGIMYGLRAYFEVKGTNAAVAKRLVPAMRFAPNAATDCHQNAQFNKATKSLRNGQLLIMRAGKLYNVQGQEVKL